MKDIMKKKEKMGWPEACTGIMAYITVIAVICTIAHCAIVTKGGG